MACNACGANMSQVKRCVIREPTPCMRSFRKECVRKACQPPRGFTDMMKDTITVQGYGNQSFRRLCTSSETLKKRSSVNKQRGEGFSCRLQIMPWLYVNVWSQTFCKIGMKWTLRGFTVCYSVLQGGFVQDRPCMMTCSPPPSRHM